MSLQSRPFIVIEAEVSRLQNFGDIGAGHRRAIPITGGRFTGEIEGEVLPGTDWQVARAGGLLEIQAHYALKTSEGQLIEVVSNGVRAAAPDVLARLDAGETVSSDDYYFRTFMRFTTGAKGLERLNAMLCVSKGARAPKGVRLEVFEIL